MIRTRSLLVFCIAGFLLIAAPGAARSADEVEAITAPSADVRLSFIQPGRIARVHVKEGDSVEGRQLLVQQDDAVAQVELERIKAQSEDTTRVRANEATLEQKRVDLKKLERAARLGSATELEVEHARLDAKIAELSLEVSRFQQEQDIREYQKAKLHIEYMALRSPIDGRVEEVKVEAGESVQSGVEVVRVVQTNPLWIEVHVPLAKADLLRGEPDVKIKFSGPHPAVVEGKIVFVSAVADAASGTLRARVEAPNDSGRPAGERVTVVLGDSGMQ